MGGNRKKMQSHLSMLFWGLILVVLDFQVNGLDLLVDGLGYLIIAVGCGGLSPLSDRFSLARTLSFVLTILWLIGCFIHGYDGLLFGAMTTIVNCVLVWQMLGGIAECAIANKRKDLAKNAENRRLAYVVTMAIGILLSLNGVNNSAVGVFFLIAIVVVLILILYLIQRVKHELFGRLDYTKDPSIWVKP